MWLSCIHLIYVAKSLNQKSYVYCIYCIYINIHIYLCARMAEEKQMTNCDKLGDLKKHNSRQQLSSKDRISSKSQVSKPQLQLVSACRVCNQVAMAAMGLWGLPRRTPTTWGKTWENNMGIWKAETFTYLSLVFWFWTLATPMRALASRRAVSAMGPNEALALATNQLKQMNLMKSNRNTSRWWRGQGKTRGSRIFLDIFEVHLAPGIRYIYIYLLCIYIYMYYAIYIYYVYIYIRIMLYIYTYYAICIYCKLL
jgi:hypothetical protein